LGSPLIRRLVELVVGVHRDRQGLHFSQETVSRWVSRHAAVKRGEPPGRKSALFSSCLGDSQTTDIGKTTRHGLQKNGIEVVVPEQRCCGMPQFDIGGTQDIQEAAQANIASLHPWVAQGYDVIVPTASCSLMLKREYPELQPDEKTKQVAERTFDVCEY